MSSPIKISQMKQYLLKNLQISPDDFKALTQDQIQPLYQQLKKGLQDITKQKNNQKQQNNSIKLQYYLPKIPQQPLPHMKQFVQHQKYLHPFKAVSNAVQSDKISKVAYLWPYLQKFQQILPILRQIVSQQAYKLLKLEPSIAFNTYNDIIKKRSQEKTKQLGSRAKNTIIPIKKTLIYIPQQKTQLQNQISNNLNMIQQTEQQPNKHDHKTNINIINDQKLPNNNLKKQTSKLNNKKNSEKQYQMDNQKHNKQLLSPVSSKNYQNNLLFLQQQSKTITLSNYQSQQQHQLSNIIRQTTIIQRIQCECDSESQNYHKRQRSTNNLSQLLDNICVDPSKLFIPNRDDPTQTIVNPKIQLWVNQLKQLCQQFQKHYPEYFDIQNNNEQNY